MRKVAFVVVAAAACVPSRNDAPLVDVEPHAEQRICYVCLASGKRDAQACPPDVDDVCAVLRSDLKRFPVITFTDAEP